MSKTLNGPEIDAILAGLRALQCKLDGREADPQDITAILTNEGEHKGLDAAGIDALCQRINFGEVKL